MDCDCGDCNCGDLDCGGDCGECCGDCDICYGDCKNCCLDCCDCDNLDCACENGFCRDCCNQCISNPTSNTSRMRRFIASFVILIMLLTDWITTTTNVSDYTKNKNLINNIYQIADSRPINNISLLAQCTNDQILLTEFHFPEIIAGCYCPDSNVKIYNETCNEDQIGCLILGNQNKMITQNWGYQANKQSFQLCARRTDISYNQLKKLNIEQPSDCELYNLKLCQDQGEQYNFFCVNKTDQCPIRDLQRTPQVPEGYEKIDQSYIENDLIISISRNTTQNYLMNFNISRGQGICQNRNLLSDGIGEDYPLNVPKWTSCELDQTFIQFLQLKMPIEQFITFNSLNETFFRTRPNFNQTQNITLFMQKSLTTYHLLKMIAIFEYFDLSIKFLDMIIYISLCYWIYMIVIIVNEIGRCLFTWALYCGQQGKQVVTVVLFYVLRFCIQVPLIVLTLLGYFLITSTELKIKAMENDSNQDSLVIFILNFSTTSQSKIKQQYQMLIGMVFAQLALDLIIAVWAYYAEKKKQKLKRQTLYNTGNIARASYLAQTHPYKPNIFAQINV